MLYGAAGVFRLSRGRKGEKIMVFVYETNDSEWYD